MLVLSRKPSERIVIAEEIVVQVLEVNGNRVRLGIEAPIDVQVRREELEPIREWETVGCGPIRKSR